MSDYLPKSITHDDHYLHEIYGAITSALKINNPPPILWDSRLHKHNLDGLYNNKSKEIKISETLKGKDQELKDTIVHELTHFLLYKKGYNRGAHGWPFLSLCTLLSMIIEFDPHQVLNSNIRNWLYNTPVKMWESHLFAAIGIINSVMSDANWKDIGAQEIVEIVMNKKPYGSTFLPPSIIMRTHKYFARTDGDIFILRDFSIAVLALAIVLLEFKLNAACEISFFFSALYFSISGFMIKYRPHYRLAVHFIQRSRTAFSHFILPHLPWNKS